MRAVCLAIVFMFSFAVCEEAAAYNPEHLERLLTTNECEDCDLSRAKLHRADLFEADLYGTIFKPKALEPNAGEQKFVVYTVEDKFPGSHHTTILSLAHFIEELKRQTG